MTYPSDDEGQFYMYDLKEFKANYWKGFWTGMVGMFAICVLLGLFIPA